MKILHIAHITNTPFSGVCSVVPEYIKSQHIKADVALLNVANEKINEETFKTFFENEE